MSSRATPRELLNQNRQRRIKFNNQSTVINNHLKGIAVNFIALIQYFLIAVCYFFNCLQRIVMLPFASVRVIDSQSQSSNLPHSCVSFAEIITSMLFVFFALLIFIHPSCHQGKLIFHSPLHPFHLRVNGVGTPELLLLFH